MIALKHYILNLLIQRITIITLFYSEVLALNTFFIQSIGSGVEVILCIFLFKLIFILTIKPNIIQLISGKVKYLYLNLLSLYSKVLLLPSVNRSKHLSFNISFMFLFFISLLFYTNFISLFIDYLLPNFINNHYYLIMSCAILYSLYLKQNIVIRIYNFIRITKFFKKMKGNRNLKLFYYFITIFIFFISLLIIYRIDSKLLSINEEGGIVFIYSSLLISVYFNFVYIINNSKLNINFKNVRKFKYLILRLSFLTIICLIFFIRFGVIMTELTDNLISNHYGDLISKIRNHFMSNDNEDPNPTNQNKQTNVNEQMNSEDGRNADLQSNVNKQKGKEVNVNVQQNNNDQIIPIIQINNYTPGYLSVGNDGLITPTDLVKYNSWLNNASGSKPLDITEDKLHTLDYLFKKENLSDLLDKANLGLLNTSTPIVNPVIQVIINNNFLSPLQSNIPATGTLINDINNYAQDELLKLFRIQQQEIALKYKSQFINVSSVGEDTFNVINYKGAAGTATQLPLPDFAKDCIKDDELSSLGLLPDKQVNSNSSFVSENITDAVNDLNTFIHDAINYKSYLDYTTTDIDEINQAFIKLADRIDEGSKEEKLLFDAKHFMLFFMKNT